MATSALIGLRKGRTIHYSRCHFDGDFDGLGYILSMFYNSADRAEALVSNEWTSVYFFELHSAQSKYYVGKVKSLAELRRAASEIGANYVYMFHPKKNKWYGEEYSDFYQIEAFREKTSRALYERGRRLLQTHVKNQIFFRIKALPGHNIVSIDNVKKISELRGGHLIVKEVAIDVATQFVKTAIKLGEIKYAQEILQEDALKTFQKDVCAHLSPEELESLLDVESLARAKRKKKIIA